MDKFCADIFIIFFRRKTNLSPSQVSSGVLWRRESHIWSFSRYFAFYFYPKIRMHDSVFGEEKAFDAIPNAHQKNHSCRLKSYYYMIHRRRSNDLLCYMYRKNEYIKERKGERKKGGWKWAKEHRNRNKWTLHCFSLSLSLRSLLRLYLNMYWFGHMPERHIHQ